MIVIADYGIGNLVSIKNMFKKIGHDVKISADTNIIDKAEKIILPGVGAFDYGMEQLNKSGLREMLDKKALVDKVPILGICLGAQILTESSEEGTASGLGWIKGKVVKFESDKLPAGYKIPNMGWSDVSGYEKSRLFTGIPDEPRFYFVHSYYLKLQNDADVLTYAEYGQPFAAGIEHENILGVQFHPEKSHKFGMKIFENFVKLY